MQALSADYWLTRFVFQRALGFIYFVAFLIIVNQFKGLCGDHGLLPVRLFVKRVEFWDSPSLFFWRQDNIFLMAMAWLGLVLSATAMLGISDAFSTWISMLTWALLWLIYMSFVNVGQTFYGFGWETLLLETGFVAIFLGPTHSPPNILIFWLLRWLLFRVMFGAGMIKLRGDECWHDLTCLQYHYETQPMPGPFSWYFHHFPIFIHRFGVVFNHFVEVVLPFAFFGPRLVRTGAGIITILFQLMLIVSGNLSWLNCITIVIAISCFDDSFFRWLMPFLPAAPLATAVTGGVPVAVAYALTVLVSALSIRPAINLFSNRQLMNASFEPLHLVNTYGAFGSVTRERTEIIIEGTDNPVISDRTKWQAYEFKGKPGDISRRPPQVTPYHYKLDWQMWFAAMGKYWHNPWIINLMGKLLQGEPDVLDLLRTNPFQSAPPKFVRAQLYLYHYTDDPHSPNWWRREFVEEYLPPLSLQDPQFRSVLEQQGWLN